MMFNQEIIPDAGSAVAAAAVLRPKPAAKQHMLYSIHYLRGIASLLVVYFHAVIQFYWRDGGGAYPLPLFGKVGVDIFFVISGFVMITSTLQGKDNVVEFLRRRIIRIVPLYWALTIAAATVAFLVPAILRSTQFDLVHLLSSLFFLPAVNPAAPLNSRVMMTPLIVPGWTLNFEALFYMLFAFALLVKNLEVRILLLTAMIGLVYALSTAYAPYSHILAFYGNLQLFEFLSGAWIGLILSQRRKPPANPKNYAYVGTLGVIILLAFAVLIYSDIAMAREFSAFLAIIASSLIVAGMVMIERRIGLPRIRFLEILGDSSFSLYLGHIFVLAIIRIIGEFLFGFPYPPLAYFVIILAIVISIVAGIVIHHLLELPLNRWAGKIWPGKR